MKQISTFLLSGALALAVASCSTSQNTVGGGSLQKRKYTKGFYLNKNHSFRSARGEAAETTLAEETIRTEAVEQQVVTEPVVTEPTVAEQTLSQPAAREHTTFVADQHTERSHQQKEVTQKVPAKKKTVTNSKQQKPAVPARPRRERENEYFIPVKDKKMQQHQSGQGNSLADEMLLLAIIFAILIPPLGVAIYEGITTRFWISLLLTILFFVPGMIYALLVVCGVI
jgi:uncharacterized membrane protein YqaE (UPF0057 family)/outer membrane biosynthesis protein TonB